MRLVGGFGHKTEKKQMFNVSLSGDGPESFISLWNRLQNISHESILRSFQLRKAKQKHINTRH
jgi:hypothetical protein